jgi:hypothetical protein
MGAVMRNSLQMGLILGGAALALAGCSSTNATQGASPTGSMFSGWFGQGATPAAATPAPPATTPAVVEDREGGGVLRQAVDKAVRVQFTIRDVARECAKDGDGLIMKIGVEGLAVIGTAGKPGPVSASLVITGARADKPLFTRPVTVKTTIPADEGQALFRVIEEGIKIPAGKGDVSITIGFKG